MHSTAWKTTLRSEGHCPRCRLKTPTTSGTTTSPTSPQHPPNHPTAITVKPCGPQYTRQHGIRPAPQHPTAIRHRAPSSNRQSVTIPPPSPPTQQLPASVRHTAPSPNRQPYTTALLQQPAYRPVASDPAAARNPVADSRPKTQKSTPGPKTGGANETSRD